MDIEYLREQINKTINDIVINDTVKNKKKNLEYLNMSVIIMCDCLKIIKCSQVEELRKPIVNELEKIYLTNREKMMEALHNHIDRLDDDGIYELIEGQELEGEGILTCGKCENLYGICKTKCKGTEVCRRRFFEYIKN